jgi:hypothetical protein
MKHPLSHSRQTLSTPQHHTLHLVFTGYTHTYININPASATAVDHLHHPFTSLQHVSTITLVDQSAVRRCHVPPTHTFALRTSDPAPLLPGRVSVHIKRAPALERRSDRLLPPRMYTRIPENAASERRGGSLPESNRFGRGRGGGTFLSLFLGILVVGMDGWVI